MIENKVKDVLNNQSGVDGILPRFSKGRDVYGYETAIDYDDGLLARRGVWSLQNTP